VLQCDEVQGYLFSPPVPAAEARALLEVGPLRKAAAA
jgi:EAL domain-containing protein (putative c-di-GMP-specific phosphodiesterase class I)